MSCLQAALAPTLGLAVGERAERVDFDPYTGDYRVFSLALAVTPSGGETLALELHRHAPGLERRIFPVLSLTVSAPDALGKCAVEALQSDAGLDACALAQWMPSLATIAAALKDGQRPGDRVLQPFLSKRAQVLWAQAPHKGMAS